MPNITRRRALQSTFAVLAVHASSGMAFAAGEKSYLFATGTTGGTYYPVGVAIATLTKVKLQAAQGISLSAINSAGSAENVKLLREDQVQFAILMGLYGDWAWNGTGRLAAQGPMSELRSVCMLWNNVEHFLIRKKFVTTGTIDDLATLDGKRFSIGKRNSGAEGGTRLILENLGFNPDELFDLAYLGYGPTADALQNGTIAAGNLPAGPPVGAVTRAYAALGEDLAVLNFTEEQVARVNGDGDLWSPHVIAPDTYPNQSEPIHTLSQPNILAVRSSVDEDAVYQITKSIFENLGFLQNIHKATKAMSLASALTGLPVPLHKGAVRYFKEVGVDVPASLIVE
jgi:TRAP transporter TAXI family solute receptor